MSGNEIMQGENLQPTRSTGRYKGELMGGEK